MNDPRARVFCLTGILFFLLQSCNGIPFGNPEPAPSASVPTASVSVTPFDTLTPSITPTITPSPTIIRIPTQDPNQPTPTFEPIPIFIGKYTATPDIVVLPTPIGPGLGFLSVEMTEKTLYWGVCKPNKARIIAKVENPEAVFSVIIFVQVKDYYSEDYTPWTSGNTMQNHWNGTFTYWQQANTTEGHNHYKKSWIRFQLVATNDFGEVIGRTKVFANEITMSPCMGLNPLQGQ